MAEKLTDSSDETMVQTLLTANAIFEIPYFQRPYKWSPQKLRRFEEDLVRLAEEGDLSEVHFLGAIIIQGSARVPTEATTYQVIDGQQRLTTIFIYLLAAIRALIEVNKMEDAKKLFESFVIVNSPATGKSNLKIQSCGQDRKAMNDVIEEILRFNNFAASLDRVVIPLPTTSDNADDRIQKNFKEAKRFFLNQRREFGAARIDTIYIAMLLGMSLVQINVKNVLSGPKIYDSLNSNQEPMTVGDLVRNDIFSRAMDLDENSIDNLNRRTWQPFYDSFGNPKDALFDKYFFPFGLIKLDSNVRKGDVYPKLRQKWIEQNLNPQQIIEELSSMQADYLDFCLPGNRSNHPEVIANLIDNLRNLGVPTSIFPFLIRVSIELRSGAISESIAASLFRGTESFLVRRGAYGLEPSGLHAAFKNLWNDINNYVASDDNNCDNLLDAFKAKIDARGTVQWPNDVDFQNSIETRSLYGSRITPYILTEYNKFLGSDGVIDTCEIEHVLPQNPSSSWNLLFNGEEQKKWTDNIGNLTLISQKMNRDVSNGPYETKRQKFSEESRYRMTRKLAEDNAIWTPEVIENRSKQISQWALQRWPEA